MATLLMRTSELAGTEKVVIGNVERARLHNEKALGQGEQEGHQKTSAEGRSRARKGKCGQKKLPQRGLGVAQLEKLRLQEQSKQEAACLASLRSLPSLGFTDQNQNGGMFFRHLKGAIYHNHNTNRGSGLPFGNGRFGPPDKLVEYLSREGHRHVGTGTRDEDIFRTLMSLASTGHSRSASLPHHERGPSISSMLPRRKDDCDTSFVCNNTHTEILGNKVHAPHSSANDPSTEGSPARRAPCALAWVASSPNSIRKPSFFSSELVNRASPVDSHASNVEMGGEKWSSPNVDTLKESVPHVLSPVSNNDVVEVGVMNAKLFPVVVKDVAGAPVFTLTNVQCYESSQDPAIVGRLPRDRTNVPVVVGATSNSDRPKELSSFQSFSSKHSWSPPHKSSGWKRPWQALHELTCKVQQSDIMDLNGEIDASDKDFGCGGVPQSQQQSAAETHHSDGIVRIVSKDSLPSLPKIRVCESCDDNRSSKRITVRDVSFCSDEALFKGCRKSESKSKDNCSIFFPPGSLIPNWRRCLSSPEIPLFAGSDHQKSGDFLTLGLSSYPTSLHLEVEASSPDAVVPEGNLKIKQMDIRSAKECHDVHLQMHNLLQVQNMKPYSPCVRNELVSGEGPTAHAHLGYKISSLASGGPTEPCHWQTGRKKEESLDLRLKLAL
ncbi:uncharacterized protein [Physcomitrium patens]|uniref:Uncharacterized protein n=1 Tax=Physcomitrium patens TaxID=3218 RepID=A0A2K1KQL5_PHYPA|nr:uncharacterized protein LOC112281304 [Physcomitrium patens]PNR56092.1 hypothetical protein PHYPA_006989 [Physcomitrium patens]|eukprot:XP_024373431.1 uncharacterized protein LOC112281304 [Physcomitrella patens]